jgi:hypothetical protein
VFCRFAYKRLKIRNTLVIFWYPISDITYLLKRSEIGILGETSKNMTAKYIRIIHMNTVCKKNLCIAVFTSHWSCLFKVEFYRGDLWFSTRLDSVTTEHGLCACLSCDVIRGPFGKFVDSPYYSIYVFEKQVEHCKKYITCQGWYFAKETITIPPQSSDSG